MKNINIRFLSHWLLVTGAIVLPIGTFADGLPDTAPEQPAPAVLTGTVKGDRVNVRVRPNVKSESVTQLSKGATVTVLETRKVHADPAKPKAPEQEWMRISLPENAKVYVHKDFVAEGAVKAQTLNVRSGPGNLHEVVGTLAKGAHVEVVATKGDWLAIKPLPSLAGWVTGQFVELNKTESPVPPAPPTPPTSTEKTVTDASSQPPVPTEPAKPIEVSIRDGIIRVGVLLPADSDAPEGATHQLYVEGKGGIYNFTLCYVKWANPQIVPSRFESKLVKIRGREIWEKGKRNPLMEVEAIDKVW